MASMNSFFETLAKLLLSPLLVAQALSVRNTATALPEPPGHRSGQFGTGTPLRLLIVGDSSASGVGATHQTEALSGQLVQALGVSHQIHWQLVARSGATTRAALPLLRSQTPVQTDIALVVLGVNDVTSQIPLANLLSARTKLYEHLFKEWGAKRVIVAGIPPLANFPLLPQPLRWFLGLQARRFDIALAQQAEENSLDYIPFDVPLTPEMMADDGFHPGPNTYFLIGRKVAQKILHR